MPHVTLYSKPRCQQCHATERYLNKHGIAYETVDISTDDDAREYVTGQLGFQSAPVVVVGDDTAWSGFRPDKIKMIPSM